MKSAVTLVFFNRPEMLQKVFEKVKAAKPPMLFLVQDGAREGRTEDEEAILKCREIVEDIDWDCQVYKNYSDVNLGCGERPQSGITWALSYVDSTIILEDDCIPDPSFFPYCDEMLDKYRYDERICYISGLNHFEEWDFGGNSYGFARGGAIWGWATWRRAWEKYDYAIQGIKDPYVKRLLCAQLLNESIRVDLWKKTNSLVEGNHRISYWDVQWGFVKYSQNQLVIVPKYNLINNIGVGVGSTHAIDRNSGHHKYRDFNFMPVKALEWPLKHPKYVLCDNNYDTLLAKCNKNAKRRMLLKAVKKKVMWLVRGNKHA